MFSFHPPVLVVIKQVAKKATTLGKFEIPKGTRVTAFIWDAHKRSDNWKDAETYNPDRFMDAQYRDEVQHDFQFLPFSAGNRKCIGYKFSLMGK